MLARPGRLALLGAALLIAAPAPVRGSEHSQVLVAKGEVAYHQGRYAEAQDLFEQAVAEDAKDVDARYALGLTFGKLGRWEEAAGSFQQALQQRPDFEAARRGLKLARQKGAAGEPAPAGAEGAAAKESEVRAPTRKAWEVHAQTGVGYDSNVVLAPRGHTLGAVDDRGDVFFTLAGGGRYDVVNSKSLLVRLEYDLYQTLHPHITDFDFRSHRVRGTVSYALRPDLWAGVQGGYNHYTLGPHSYLSEPFVMPFLSYLEASWGMSQVTWRHGDSTYLTTPFHEIRDGRTDAIGGSQTFYLDEGAKYLTLGFQYDRENPSSKVGNDWENDGSQAYVGVGFPAWCKTSIDLLYLYRYDDYVHRNSFAGFRKQRYDDEHHMYAGVRRPITEHLSAAIVYYGTVNTSNIPLFDYRRSVVSALLQVTY
jgi:tetratricopeptide (TPR) repeat protein